MGKNVLEREVVDGIKLTINLSVVVKVAKPNDKGEQNVGGSWGKDTIASNLTGCSLKSHINFDDYSRDNNDFNKIEGFMEDDMGMGEIHDAIRSKRSCYN